ncbi:MAG: diacylglycerol/lipid kinase family protein [Hyphomicrobiaceae bacterium]
MRRRFFVIDNTTSGYGRRSLAARVLDLLRAQGASIASCGEPDKDAAFERATEAVRSGTYDAIVAVGGDGTIRHAASVVAGTDVPLGIIPLGTGNVLAREIGLCREPDALAKALLAGPARSMMAPTANGEVFLLMAGVGFDGRVIRALNPSAKGLVGKLAYAGPLLSALKAPADKLEVLLDGRLHQANWAVIAKARHYGGAFVIAEHADLHGPGLRAVLFNAPDRGSLLASLLALASGRLATCRNVTVVGCTRAEIRGQTAASVQVDGDPFGSTPLVVEAQGHRVSLIVPALAG